MNGLPPFALGSLQAVGLLKCDSQLIVRQPIAGVVSKNSLKNSNRASDVTRLQLALASKNQSVAVVGISVENLVVNRLRFAELVRADEQLDKILLHLEVLGMLLV